MGAGPVQKLSSTSSSLGYQQVEIRQTLHNHLILASTQNLDIFSPRELHSDVVHIESNTHNYSQMIQMIRTCRWLLVRSSAVKAVKPNIKLMRQWTKIMQEVFHSFQTYVQSLDKNYVEGIWCLKKLSVEFQQNSCSRCSINCNIIEIAYSDGIADLLQCLESFITLV